MISVDIYEATQQLTPVSLRRSSRAKAKSQTEVQSSIRDEIFKQESVDEDVVKEEAERMDMLMRNLIGNADEEEEESKEEENNGTDRSRPRSMDLVDNSIRYGNRARR